MSDLVKKVSGQGKVFSGERFVANVQYRIRIWPRVETVDLLTGPPMIEPPSEDTELDITEPIAAAVGELLTLHLEDGRKLDFWIVATKCEPFGGVH